MLTTTVFAVSALAWRSSKDTIEHRIRAMEGVIDAEVSLYSRTMTVTYDDQITGIRAIIAETDACGYKAFVQTEDTEIIPAAGPEPAARGERILPAAAAIAAAGSVLRLPLLCALAAAVAFWRAGPDLAAGLRGLLRPKSTDSPMTSLLCVISFLAGICAMAAGRDSAPFFTAAAILPAVRRFVTEMIRKEKSRQAGILDSRRKLPSYVRVYNGSRENSIRLSALQKDEIIVLRPGDTVPADGRVVRGYAKVDESRLSGKKEPVEKRENAFLYANSVILEGALSVRIEQLGSTTAMMKLCELAEKTAEMHRYASPLADFGRLLFPYMILASLIVLGGWLWLRGDPFFALSAAVSVAACEALSAFTLISSEAVKRSASEAAEHHVLFTSIESMSGIGRTDVLLMEQDGAVTRSELSVTDFIPAEGVSVARFEYIVYALLSNSGRPFSRAVTRYLRMQKLSDTDVNDFIRMNRGGRRRFTSIGRCTYGTMRELEEEETDTSAWREQVERFHREGKRVMLFAEDRRIIGAVAVRRQILDGAAEAIRSLQKKDVRIILVTDGTDYEAEWLRQQIRPDDIMIRPGREEIEARLHSLRSEEMRTAWLSRTDAAAYSGSADLCIAIDCGTDISREGCGLLLTRDSLADLLTAIRCSEQLSDRIGKQQMAMLFYHVCMVILCGWAVPVFLRIALPAWIPAIISAGAAWLILTASRRPANGKKR